ncbi:MAG: LUD domain-containing protein [Bifidobacteriaceae bacterium]|jgi:L-lactate dehydrogenase complex protein LldG|nr:LUD domain-containing protein [Bifidobacteriaceae bacterium]
MTATRGEDLGSSVDVPDTKATKEAILAGIRAALADVPPLPPERDVPVRWGYGSTASGIVSDAVTGLFAERCGDYGAAVVRVAQPDAAAEAGRLLADHGAARVAVPAGLDQAVAEALKEAGVEVRGDDPPLTAAELDALDGVVTACRVAIAETGTLVLDHAADQGRRALTLVPDLHLCLVRADQIAPDVPQAVARLRPSVLEGRPLTWVSGPSATVDIELTRVEGVHGPRTLLVVIGE